MDRRGFIRDGLKVGIAAAAVFPSMFKPYITGREILGMAVPPVKKSRIKFVDGSAVTVSYRWIEHSPDERLIYFYDRVQGSTEKEVVLTVSTSTLLWMKPVNG